MSELTDRAFVEGESTDFKAGPLAGLRVIELATYVAGPSCGVALAQLGADVIRVDPIGGATDFHRLPLDSNGESLYWEGLNQAKRSVEIDTHSEEGRNLIGELLRSSGPNGGVLVTNAVNQEWLSYEHMSTFRDDLIKVQIQGRDDGKPAVDYTINCEVGFPLITGPSEYDRPVNHVLPAWDLLCGLHAAVGVLSAVGLRSRTGKGSSILVSLADVAISTMSQLGFLSDVVLNRRSRSRDGNYVFGSFGCNFRSRDGRDVMVVALTERQWQKLLNLTGATEIIASLERSTGADMTSEDVRYKFREVLAGVFRPWFESRDFDDIATALEEKKVLWGPYRSMEELIYNPASILNTSPLVDQVVRPGMGAYPSTRGVLRFENWVARPATNARRLGEDTASLLSEMLKMDSGVIDEWQAKGVVGGLRSPRA